MLKEGALKMAKIEIMKRRIERRSLPAETHSRDSSFGYREAESLHVPPSPIAPVHPGAVELPAEDNFTPPHQHRTPGNPPYPHEAVSSVQDKYSVVSSESNSSRLSGEIPYRRRDDDKYTYQPPPHSAYNPSEPPPRPPKTPINETVHPALRPSSGHDSIHPALRPHSGRPNGGPRPPYPDYDELPPPPLVSKLRKPEYTPRQTG